MRRLVECKILIGCRYDERQSLYSAMSIGILSCCVALYHYDCYPFWYNVFLSFFSYSGFDRQCYFYKAGVETIG